jgi:hypothetical protein
MGSYAVLTDTDDHHILGLESLISSGKSAGLAGTTGGVILGIEI